MKIRESSFSSTRRGFTLLELMLVITIIGILLTIVVTSIGGVIRSARVKRAEVLCKLVQEGLAAYYAQNDRWPGSVGDSIENGTFHPGDNSVTLSASQTREMIKVLVEESKKGNPLMDITGLFVSRGDSHGMDFLDAIHGTRKSSRKMKLAEMHFGYPNASNGRFRAFKIIYNVPSDHMEVTTQ
jgi:prepilin-type N-terminal cleavage/methylation domain-containing protein